MYYAIDQWFTIKYFIEKFSNIYLVYQPHPLSFPSHSHSTRDYFDYDTIRLGAVTTMFTNTFWDIGAVGLYGFIIVGGGVVSVYTNGNQSCLLGCSFVFVGSTSCLKPNSHQKSVLRSNTYLKGKLLPAKQTDVICLTVE